MSKFSVNNFFNPSEIYDIRAKDSENFREKLNWLINQPINPSLINTIFFETKNSRKENDFPSFREKELEEALWAATILSEPNQIELENDLYQNNQITSISDDNKTFLVNHTTIPEQSEFPKTVNENKDEIVINSKIMDDLLNLQEHFDKTMQKIISENIPNRQSSEENVYPKNRNSDEIKKSSEFSDNPIDLKSITSSSEFSSDGYALERITTLSGIKSVRTFSSDKKNYPDDYNNVSKPNNRIKFACNHLIFSDIGDDDEGGFDDNTKNNSSVKIIKYYDSSYSCIKLRAIIPTTSDGESNDETTDHNEVLSQTKNYTTANSVKWDLSTKLNDNQRGYYGNYRKIEEAEKESETKHRTSRDMGINTNSTQILQKRNEDNPEFPETNQSTKMELIFENTDSDNSFYLKLKSVDSVTNFDNLESSKSVKLVKSSNYSKHITDYSDDDTIQIIIKCAPPEYGQNVPKRSSISEDNILCSSKCDFDCPGHELPQICIKFDNKANFTLNEETIEENNVVYSIKTNDDCINDNINLKMNKRSDLCLLQIGPESLNPNNSKAIDGNLENFPQIQIIEGLNNCNKVDVILDFDSLSLKPFGKIKEPSGKTNGVFLDGFNNKSKKKTKNDEKSKENHLKEKVTIAKTENDQRTLEPSKFWRQKPEISETNLDKSNTNFESKEKRRKINPNYQISDKSAKNKQSSSNSNKYFENPKIPPYSTKANLNNNSIKQQLQSAQFLKSNKIAEDSIIPLPCKRVSSSIELDRTKAKTQLHNKRIKHYNRQIETCLNEIGIDKLREISKPVKCCRMNQEKSYRTNGLGPYAVSIESLPLNDNDIKVIKKSIDKVMLRKIDNSIDLRRGNDNGGDKLTYLRNFENDAITSNINFPWIVPINCIN